MPLNAAEFRRRSEEMFAGSYLSSIGVIQSVALGGLVLKIAESPTSTVLMLEGMTAILAILLVVTEYTWWLIIMRKTPSFLDAVFPYLLGILEYVSIALADRQGTPVVYQYDRLSRHSDHHALLRTRAMRTKIFRRMRPGPATDATQP